MRILMSFVVMCCLLSFTGSVLAASPSERIQDSVAILQEMFRQPDMEAGLTLLQKAKGVAIFPAVIKAGVMIGGRYGEGLVLVRDERGRWYGPHFVKIKGVSYGLQFGAQSTALVMVITNANGLKGFTGDKVTIGGELAVAAGPVGRSGSAATDSKLQAAIYSYSLSKGAFAGISLEGSIIEVDEKANAEYWGKEISPEKALASKASSREIKPLIIELQNLITSK